MTRLGLRAGTPSCAKMPRRCAANISPTAIAAGNHWIVGDVRNTPGRSMHVRLKDNAKGPAGKWVDEATGEYGDLLDVIRE